MTNKFFIILSSILLILLLSCTNNNYIKNGVTGIINVRGHEPFTYLSIETEKGDILEIESSDSLRNILWDMQGLKVSLEINELKKNMNRDVIVAVGHKLNIPDKKKWEK